MTKRENVLGRGVFDVFPDNPDDTTADGVSNLRGSLLRVLEFRRPDVMATQKYDVRRSPEAGGGFEERYWSVLNSPILDDNGNVAWIMNRAEDVTELVKLRAGEAAQDQLAREQRQIIARLRSANEELARRSEENIRLQKEKDGVQQQLVQAQKMEAVGTLTGGLAHDFNNLLAVVIGNLDTLQEARKDDPELNELAGEALEAALRGADLTRRLLAFARRQPLQPEQINVNAFVQEISKLLTRVLGDQIEVMLDLAPDIWPVIADPAQLGASLTNLATNARDAMPKGGHLIIATHNRYLDHDYASGHPEISEGEYAMIEVSDAGIGIAPTILNQIFEPFFTTKDRDKGSGLGLSMVFGFMKQSGGHINVYSEIGKGTTFRLYLPRAHDSNAAQKHRPAAVSSRGCGETVLVVDDDAAVRRIVARQLRELNYRVLEAESGTAALGVLNRESVDLVFTDVVMPGEINGYELARRSSVNKPNLPIVLSSGFPAARIDREIGPLSPPVRLLSKPYRKEDLASILREVLDGLSRGPNA
jgi:signal transduction histidine kinase